MAPRKPVKSAWMRAKRRALKIRNPAFPIGRNHAGLCGLSVDFQPIDNTGAISFNPSSQTVGIWDAAKWDANNWGGGLITTRIWQGVTGIGFAGSINLTAVAQGIELHWASTDYVMEPGGVL